MMDACVCLPCDELNGRLSTFLRIMWEQIQVLYVMECYLCNEKYVTTSLAHVVHFNIYTYT